MPKPAPPPKPVPPAAPVAGPPPGRKPADILAIAGGKDGDGARGVAALLGRLHDVPRGMATIPLEFMGYPRGSLGGFTYQLPASGPGAPLGIAIRPGGDHPEMTIAHEFGHFLELFGLDGHNNGRRDWKNLPASDPMRAFKAAVSGSRAARELVAIASSRSVTVGGVAARVDGKYARYLLDWKELWARAYAQWAATRSGDPAMLRQLEALRDPARSPYHHRQWADDDFAPIASAIDDLFRGMGLRK